LYAARASEAVRKHRLPELVDSRSMTARIGKRISILCSLAAGKEVYTVGGNHMCFLNLEDDYGVFDAVAFPSAYRQAATALWSHLVYIAVGTVEAEYGAVQLRLEALIHPTAAKKTAPAAVSSESMPEGILQRGNPLRAAQGR
jgi:DNA polymerase III alpha subunit